MNTKAFWVEEAGLGRLREESVPAPGPGEVLVRTLFSGVSRGTESLVFNGRVPPAMWPIMRCAHQGGDFDFPVKYGYIVVGEIEAGDGPVGQRVFCLHPHQQRFVVPASAARALPDNLPPERAVLAANMETAINGVWDGQPGPGDKITVIGAGVVGALVAWLVGRIPGTQVCLVDMNPAREKLAHTLGVDFALPGAVSPEQDLVFHCSGSPAGLRQSLDIAGVEATIVELSWYGERDVSLALGGPFHPRRLRIQSSQVGRIPAHRQARWDYDRRMGLALRFLADHPMLDALIDEQSEFMDLPQTMSRLAKGAGGVLCHRVHYSGSGKCTG